MCPKSKCSSFPLPAPNPDNFQCSSSQWKTAHLSACTGQPRRSRSYSGVVPDAFPIQSTTRFCWRSLFFHISHIFLYLSPFPASHHTSQETTITCSEYFNRSLLIHFPHLLQTLQLTQPGWSSQNANGSQSPHPHTEPAKCLPLAQHGLQSRTPAPSATSPPNTLASLAALQLEQPSLSSSPWNASPWNAYPYNPFAS